MFFILFIMPLRVQGQKHEVTTAQYREDFNYFFNSINEDYCYFYKKQTDWDMVKKMYSPIIDTVTTRAQFVSVLERIFYEIYDHHASLNTNNPESQRLVPSGTDIWAEFVQGVPTITEVRRNFGAEKAGITAGMEVVAINDVPVGTAIKPFRGKCLKAEDAEANNYALRIALAGNHIQKRKLTLSKKGKTKDFYPDADDMALEHIHYSTKTEAHITDGVGYIRINDFLYDNSLIQEFDSVMLTMRGTRALILDLRETPSGGNTTVARAVLGWFTSKDMFYQKHELYAEEKAYGIKRSWEEIVSPRAGKYYDKPLVILADHWTGSIAEGITIAFDGMKRATVTGTTLARLNGAVYSYQMPNSKINFSVPVERVYHVDGNPREFYEPPVKIDVKQTNPASGTDPFIDRAMQILK